MESFFKLGSWNAICDVCGFQYKAEELRKNWKGLYVCSKDFESRHPQEYLRVSKETTGVSWAQYDLTDTPYFCYIWDNSNYVGMATVGCAVVGPVSLSYETLLGLKNGNN